MVNTLPGWNNPVVSDTERWSSLLTFAQPSAAQEFCSLALTPGDGRTSEGQLRGRNGSLLGSGRTWGGVGVANWLVSHDKYQTWWLTLKSPVFSQLWRLRPEVRVLSRLGSNMFSVHMCVCLSCYLSCLISSLFRLGALGMFWLF